MNKLQKFIVWAGVVAWCRGGSAGWRGADLVRVGGGRDLDERQRRRVWRSGRVRWIDRGDHAARRLAGQQPRRVGRRVGLLRQHRSHRQSGPHQPARQRPADEPVVQPGQRGWHADRPQGVGRRHGAHLVQRRGGAGAQPHAVDLRQRHHRMRAAASSASSTGTRPATTSCASTSIRSAPRRRRRAIRSACCTTARSSSGRSGNVPEPTTLVLMGLGLFGAATAARRKR